MQSKKQSINSSCLQTKVMVKQQQDKASCTISVIYYQSTGCWLCYTFHCILLHSVLHKQCTVFFSIPSWPAYRTATSTEWLYQMLYWYSHPPEDEHIVAQNM